MAAIVAIPGAQMWRHTQILKAGCRQDTAVRGGELFCLRARPARRSSDVPDRRGDGRIFLRVAVTRDELAADLCQSRERYGQEAGAGEGNRTLVISLEGCVQSL